MAVQSEPDIDLARQRHPSPDEEYCPLCGQVLPHDLTLEELEKRLREKESRAAEVHENSIRASLERESAQKIEAFKKQAAQESAEREKAIRAETKTAIETALKADVDKANVEKATAHKEKVAATQQVVKLKAQQKEQAEKAVEKALAEQREALDAEKTKAVQKAQAGRFETNKKLQQQVEKLKRQLENKTADELGEGAEIDLYETLREECEDDKITRVKKGQAGADILHEIIHNGQVCGTIIYDSKNHSAWRNSFVDKLKQDQIAAKSDHAILTTSVFPSGSRQLHVQDDVIILNPARALELVRIIRQHIIQTHRLRLSAEERDEKTQALYEFITSERCHQLIARHDTITEELLKVDVKEKTAHDKVWRTRGQLLKEVQKVHSAFTVEIDRIIEDETLR